MEKLNTTNFFLVGGMITDYHKEVDAEKWTNVPYVLSNIAAQISNASGVVMVDSLTDPTMFFWGSRGRSPVIDKTIFTVSLIYVKPEKRGSGVAINKMLEALEQEAKNLGCNMIVGASWKDGPLVEEASKMWSTKGYEELETYYHKQI